MISKKLEQLKTFLQKEGGGGGNGGGGNGGDGGGILGARRAVGFAGRPVRAVFRRAAGLVFPVPIPIS